MRTVPTHADADVPKILYSSGAITVADYSNTMTGDVAKFHHSLGGVIVEASGGKFSIREVGWDGERFIDLDTEFDAEGVWEAEPPEALVMGDVHVGLHSPDVMSATFGEGGIVPTLKPKRLVLHDLFDGRSVNPHDRRKQLTRALDHARGLTSLADELGEVRAWLDGYAHAFDLEVAIVASNHDDFLNRWLETGERHVEPQNRPLYHRLSADLIEEALAKGAERDRLLPEIGNAFEKGLRLVGYTGPAKFLRLDEPYRFHAIELGMHGHLGSNGSRGSAKNLSRIGTRSIIGHSHGPTIWQGVYQVGHSAVKDHRYNKGPSSWLTSHALLHANGQRQMINIIGDRWRAA